MRSQSVLALLALLVLAAAGRSQPPPLVAPPMTPAAVAPPIILEESPLPADRLWIGVGILLGWSERSQLPASFNFPATGGPLTFSERSKSVVAAGIALQGGFWFGRSLQHGIDASYLNLEDWYKIESANITMTPTGPVPAGTAELGSHYFTSDVNYRRRLYESDCVRIDGLLGYRNAGLCDRAAIINTFVSPTIGIVRWKDTAEAFNEFNGGQLGLAGTLEMGPWLFSAAGKVALGGVHSEIAFHGATTVLANLPDGVTLYTADQFAVLPSVSMMISRQFGAHCRGYVGFEFQYLTQAARAAETFSNALPTFKSDFWTQGLTLGMEWRY